MKKRSLALLLAGALALSLLGATVLAAEGDASAPDGSVQSDETQTPEEVPVPEAGPVPQAEEPSEGTDEPEEPDTAAPEYIPDPVGSITFGNLERRLREGNLNLLALEENIQMIRSIDYDKMQEDLRKKLNEIADLQWSMQTAGSQIPPIMIPDPTAPMNPDKAVDISGILKNTMSMSASSMVASLQQSYNSVRDAFDDIKDGKLQADNEDLVWQLENAQNQVVMAGETLYIALLDMERSGQTLDRNLTALDRTLTELDLRYQLGHISSQTLKQAQAGRTALVSGQQTLNSNIQTYKMQLELLIGAELTGKIRLGALPQVTSAQLNAMDLEADLEAAKAASYSLYEAKQTLDDAEKDFKDAGKEHNYNEKKYEYVMAQHQWQAAQYSYNATVQNYEMSFRTLYLQVKDYQQVLAASRTALAVEQDNYSVAQLKYSQGSLSRNALSDAEDKAKEAQENVDGATIDLFTAYHNYRWAVDYGILN